MNITCTTVITTATMTTPNGFYELEYSITENQVVKLQASVHTLPEGESNEKMHIGYIILENDNLHCSLPSGLSYSAFFSDFDGFVTKVQAECGVTNTETQEAQK